MEKKEKNSQKQEFKGRNLEEVINLAEHALKLPRSKFNYEIIAEKTKLFGMKTKEIVIQAWPKEGSEENTAAEFLDKLLSRFPLDIEYQVKRKMILFIYIVPSRSILMTK